MRMPAQINKHKKLNSNIGLPITAITLQIGKKNLKQVRDNLAINAAEVLTVSKANET